MNSNILCLWVGHVGPDKSVILKVIPRSSEAAKIFRFWIFSRLPGFYRSISSKTSTIWTCLEMRRWTGYVVWLFFTVCTHDTHARQRVWSWKLYDEPLLSRLSKQADQEVGVTCCQEEEHNEEMEWVWRRTISVINIMNSLSLCVSNGKALCEKGKAKLPFKPLTTKIEKNVTDRSSYVKNVRAKGVYTVRHVSVHL